MQNIQRQYLRLYSKINITYLAKKFIFEKYAKNRSCIIDSLGKLDSYFCNWIAIFIGKIISQVGNQMFFTKENKITN